MEIFGLHEPPSPVLFPHFFHHSGNRAPINVEQLRNLSLASSHHHLDRLGLLRSRSLELANRPRLFLLALLVGVKEEGYERRCRSDCKICVSQLKSLRSSFWTVPGSIKIAEFCNALNDNNKTT
jgi:hypothetical protein